jgi:hypothetical protein
VVYIQSARTCKVDLGRWQGWSRSLSRSESRSHQLRPSRQMNGLWCSESNLEGEREGVVAASRPTGIRVETRQVGSLVCR